MAEIIAVVASSIQYSVLKRPWRACCVVTGNWVLDADCGTISKMHELAARLLRTIRKQELLRAGDRVDVAVSGGADSVALLCLLGELRGELGIVLSVAHVNHKLRGAESDEDEQFVTEQAAARGLELHAVTRRLEPDAAEAPAQGSSGDAESTVRVK